MSDPSPFRILVIDDDTGMRQSLVDLLEAAEWQVEALSRASKVGDHLIASVPDVILSDVRMPGMSGLELLASLDAEAPPVVLISAHGDIPMAVEAMQNGAYSFLEKPYEPRRLLTALRHAAEQSRMRLSNERLKERLYRLSGLDRILLGETEDVANLRRDILDFAETDVAVLVEGETGTGKELVARALHDLGKRPDAPFLAVNCAALSSDRFESEMFGVEGQNKGRLVAASGGTLFLDEICACPLEVQAKLLRVIEDKEVLPIGASAPIPVDFRVLSATNQDVSASVADGHLRQDLLFRINTVTITVPPLRQRPDDLTILAAHFLAEYARIYEIEAPEILPEDLTAMLAHNWPGNVRELRHACERRVLSARRGAGSLAQSISGGSQIDDLPATLREAVAALERELIAKAVRSHEGRMDSAAEALGIGRRTLNEKIVKLGLDKDALL